MASNSDPRKIVDAMLGDAVDFRLDLTEPTSLTPQEIALLRRYKIKEAEELVENLSIREAEILKALINGRSQSGVATYLGLEERSVAADVESIKTKLNASSSADLVRIATYAGLSD